MKKRSIISVLALVLALVLIVPAFSSVTANAASTFGAERAEETEPGSDDGAIPGSTEDSLPFTTVTIDKSKTFSGKSDIYVSHTCAYIQLKGKNAVINKINKELKKLAKASFSNKSNAFGYAKTDCKQADKSDNYYDTLTQTVTYFGDRYLSVLTTEDWYAGGVSNTNEYGYVFDLTTGKRITKVTKLTKIKKLAKIKNTIIKKATKDGYDPAEVSSMKAKDFKFYISEDGKVMIVFGPYELGWGGWTKAYEFEGNF